MKCHDAKLTERGEEQCMELRRGAAMHVRPEVVVTSPLTRTVQTASLAFGGCGAPFVACEAIRETVNFLCDGRRAISAIAAEFPSVDFSLIEHDHDEIWARYERKHGPQESYLEYRETGDIPSLVARAREALDWIRRRPERELAVVSHQAYLTHLFNFGQPLLEGARRREGALEAQPTLIEYEGAGCAEWARSPFANCEMRSMVATFVE